MNLKLHPTVRLVDLSRALRSQGYRIVCKPDKGAEIERRNHAGDCDLCGEWASQLTGGACEPCTSRIIKLENDA